MILDSRFVSSSVSFLKDIFYIFLKLLLDLNVVIYMKLIGLIKKVLKSLPYCLFHRQIHKIHRYACSVKTETEKK